MLRKHFRHFSPFLEFFAHDLLSPHLNLRFSITASTTDAGSTTTPM
jgi:hypothetical protein